MHSRHTTVIVFGLLLALGSRVVILAESDADLGVTASFSQRVVAPDESIALSLSRPLNSSEMRVAVFLNNTDVSSLFELTQRRLKYNAQIWPLPVGDSPLVVYVVTRDDQWRELARLSLRVRAAEVESKSEMRFMKSGYTLPTRSAIFDEQKQDVSNAPTKTSQNHKFKFLPSLTLGLNSQPAQSTFPDSARPQRATFVDLTMQASLKNEAAYGVFNSQSSFDFAGSSFQQEALRFGTLGEAAPKVDLSSYLFQFQTGKIKYQLGHFSYGTQRQLINSFSSRGLMITVPFLKHFDFSAAVMNGTQLVGYHNFFGLDKTKHQMLSGTLGVELFPKRPGGLRFEVGVLNAYFQPISGVNRGVITDTQRSRGLAFRLIANDTSNRFHFEGGFTRSHFISPNDPTLSQGLTLVTIPQLTRNAHFLEASYEVLRNVSLSKTKKANLRVAFKEENVAPLFRSLGAFAQADKVFYEVSADGSINEITARFGHNNFHDNLRNIPSILRSLNNSTQFALASPVSALLNRTKSSLWMPRVGYSFNRFHAFGAAIPVNGGFEQDPTTIPDLVGTVHTFSSDWLVKKFSISYSFNHSLQDNRQVGRQFADQSVSVNSGRVGYALNNRVSLNVDLSNEKSTNRETGRIDRSTRLGPGFNWQFTNHLGVAANLSNTIAGDAANTSQSRNTEFDSQLTYRFSRGNEGLKKVSAQFFLRYANHYSHFLNRPFVVDTLGKNQTLTANFSLTFF